MSTTYFTPDGPDQVPINIELITVGGTRVGYFGRWEEATFTWNLHAADTAHLVLPLDSLSARLTDMRGSYLICAEFNGVRHISVPAKVQVTGNDDDPSTAVVDVTAVGGWQFFDNVILTPSYTAGWRLYKDSTASWREPSGDGWTTSGKLTEVIREVISSRASEMRLPITVTGEDRVGPETMVQWQWQKMSEAIKPAIAGSGFYVDIRHVTTGDAMPGAGQVAAIPGLCVRVLPYRDRGIRWTVQGGDVVGWESDKERAKLTSLYEVFRPSDFDSPNKDKPWWYVQSLMLHDYERSAWSQRQDTHEWKYPDTEPRKWYDLLSSERRDYMAADGIAQKLEKGETHSVSATIDASSQWRFGTPETPGENVFSIGDLVDVEIPLGSFQLAVSSVEVKITRDELSVTPTVSVPDSPGYDSFDMTAELQKRVSLLERGR